MHRSHQTGGFYERVWVLLRYQSPHEDDELFVTTVQPTRLNCRTVRVEKPPEVSNPANVPDALGRNAQTDELVPLTRADNSKRLGATNQPLAKRIEPAI